MDKFCLNCGSQLTRPTQLKFCCQACAATYNNKLRGKTTKGMVFVTKCISCGSDFECSIHTSKNKRFCKNCRKTKQPLEKRLTMDEWYKKWISGEITGSLKSNGHYSPIVRRYLMSKYNNSCQECGWSKINPATQTIPLEIHHIDGDFSNNRPENLQLLCPNCHSLTENYGSRNKNCTRKRKYIVIN